MARSCGLLELQPARRGAPGWRNSSAILPSAPRGAGPRSGASDRAEIALVPEMVATEDSPAASRRRIRLAQWDLFHAPAVDATLVDAARRRLLEMARNQQLSGSPAGFRGWPRGMRTGLFAARPMGCARRSRVRAVAPIEWLTGAGGSGSRLPIESCWSGLRAVSLRRSGWLCRARQGGHRREFFWARGGGALGERGRAGRRGGSDLSLSGLKAACGSTSASRTTRHVRRRCDWIEHREAARPGERPGRAAGEILAETIGMAFRKRGPARLERAYASLPDMHWISRRRRFRRRAARSWRKSCNTRRLQLASLRATSRGRTTSSRPAKRRRGRHPVLLVAVKKAAARSALGFSRSSKSRSTRCRSIGWRLPTRHGLPGAFPNAFHSFQAAGVPATAAALDVGSETSTLVVHGPGQLDARLIRVGGYAFTRAVAARVRVAAGGAEKLKRDPRSLDFLSRLHEAVRPSRMLPPAQSVICAGAEPSAARAWGGVPEPIACGRRRDASPRAVEVFAGSGDGRPGLQRPREPGRAPSTIRFTEDNLRCGEERTMQTRRNEGFTLVEVLVVILIIILIGLLLPAVQMAGGQPPLAVPEQSEADRGSHDA